jgi:hypothetical protein
MQIILSSIYSHVLVLIALCLKDLLKCLLWHYARVSTLITKLGVLLEVVLDVHVLELSWVSLLEHVFKLRDLS